MPRIPVLDQQTRLQVSSPTPIGSDERARIEGENIERFGASLQRTADNLTDYAALAKKTADTAQSETLKPVFEAASQAAMFDAQTNAKRDPSKPNGDPTYLVDHYKDSFTKSIQPILDGISDPEMKQRAANFALVAQNSKSDNLYNATIQKSFEDIHSANMKAVGNTISNISTADPSAVIALTKTSIASNTASIAAQMAYSGEAKQKITDQTNEQMAMAAVDTLVRQNKYGLANDAINQLAGSMDEKTQLFYRDSVQKAQMQNTKQTLLQQDQADRDSADAIKQRQTDTFGKFYFSIVNEKDPIKKQAGIDAAQKQGAMGNLTPAQMQHLVTVSGVNKTANNGFAGFNVGSAIANGNDPAQVRQDLADHILNGHIDPKLAQQFDNIAANRIAAKGNAELTQKYASSDAYMQQQVSGFKLPAATAAPILAATMAAKDTLIKQGVDPNEATIRALRQTIPVPDSQPKIPGVGAQSTQKDLDAITPQMKALHDKVVSGAMGLKDQQNALVQLNAYKVRLLSARIHAGDK